MDLKLLFLPALLLAAGAGAQTATAPDNQTAVPTTATQSASSAPAAPGIQPSGPAQSANAMQTYVALRNDLPGAESAMVKNFALDREGAHFQFDQGTFYFYAPVAGKVTGAVFVGNGKFDLSPDDSSAQRSLAQLTKGAPMTQDFSTLVLRFTDGTAGEIRKASTGTGGAPEAAVKTAAEDFAGNYRKDLNDNLELRLLADVIGSGQGEFFLASFHMGSGPAGKNLLFIVDPEGTPHASPDQVELTTWSDTGVQPWLATTMQEPDQKRQAKRDVVIDEKLDVAFDHDGAMKGSAETTVRMLRDGVRVLRLNLYPTLRVKGVYSEDGTPLDFVQEDAKLDPDFGIILPKPARVGDTVRVLTQYSGTDALLPTGNQTYYLAPAVRKTWYPAGVSQFGNLIKFHMTFHIPDDLQIVASGKQVSLGPDGKGMMKAVWETDIPIPAAGFNLGNFKTDEVKTPAGVAVDAYANVGLPDRYTDLQKAGTLGDLSTLPDLKTELSQADLAERIFTVYFGRLPYDHVTVTQQSGCIYGESWPMLVSVPMCGFWAPAVQRQVGLLTYDSSYWRETTPYELARQWWGSVVGFKTYRDQWMSEGFATLAVGEYVRTVDKPEQWQAFWQEQQENLLQKNPQGVRPIDVGPLTQGMSVNKWTEKDDLRHVLDYSKGGFVLHMLEQMYWTAVDGEVPFKTAMQRFAQEYAGRAATTEDFKASLEKNMPKQFDLRGDGKLDWFFDEYVYGTDIPHYTMTTDFAVDSANVTTAHLKLTQSNVSNDFVMLVPLYLELKNGEIQRIANVVVHGDTTLDQNVRLGKLPSPAKRMFLNYNSDVLCDSN